MTVDSPDRRQEAQAISNALAKLHREYYGRGPNNVRTVIGHDHVISFLEDIATTLERTLLDSNEVEAVRQTRLAFQRAMETRFVGVVEEIVGRKVRAFLSQVAFDPDLSVEVFVLEEDTAHPAPEGIA